MGDWVIAFAGGKTLVGKVDDLRNISPVYELQAGLQQTREGAHVAIVAVPLLFLPSISHVPLAQDTIVIRVTSLDRNEQRAVMGAVEGAEKMAATIRAANSGIVLAGAMPKKVAP